MAQINTIKRGNKWQYRFEGKIVDGKRKQYSKSGFLTKKEALIAGTKALNEYLKRIAFKKIIVKLYMTSCNLKYILLYYIVIKYK